MTTKQKARRYGGKDVSRKQLATRKAHGYGGNKENAAQREGRSRGSHKGGRANLKQRSPVFYSGRAKHSGCGKWLDIKAPKRTDKPGVCQRCPHCQKVAYFSIKGHNLLKVVKGKVVKRKR